MFIARLSAVALSVVVMGCGGANNREFAVTPVDRDIITFQEIDASGSTGSAYDVIKKLRGNFLSYRGRTSLANTSSPDPFVFVDEQAYGPVSSLRTIPASHVESIRLYRTWEAQTKFGTNLMGGVIAVYTKTQ